MTAHSWQANGYLRIRPGRDDTPNKIRRKLERRPNPARDRAAPRSDARPPDGGIPVALSAQSIDLQALVGKIVDEVRVAHPTSTIEVRVEGECSARIDVDRFEQEPAFLPLLFNPFARGDNPRGQSEGLGLGLYISERIIDAHGGRLSVQSSYEAGTVVEVIVPRRL